MEKVNYDFYSNLLDSTSTCLLTIFGETNISLHRFSLANSTCHHVDEGWFPWNQTRTYQVFVVVRTLAKFFTRYLSECIEVSQEYRVQLCLTFINLKKALNNVETETVFEAICNRWGCSRALR
ncbi:unnamed protein product [Haemonchus placei]|uniref:BTB domain-containing protein n=1 Tax=Haemonchus placei TaxID=6290 RepID=A0A0N4W3V4_HAEPC|nr:unnamed protein product [Haemonchus placei]